MTQLFAQKGWLGAPLAELGIKVAFTPIGIFIAMIFIGIPFVVRTVQPVLQDLDFEIGRLPPLPLPEAGAEAATSIGELVSVHVIPRPHADLAKTPTQTPEDVRRLLGEDQRAGDHA